MRSIVAMYVEYCKYQRGLSEKTIKAYVSDVGLFLGYTFSELGKNEIEITANDYLKYISTVADVKKPKTIKRCIISLKLFFKYLEKIGKIKKSPVEGTEVRVKEGRQLPKIINKKTMSLFLEFLYAKKKELMESKNSFEYRKLLKHLCIIELLFSSGMRVSEVSSLRVGQICHKDKFIDVNGKGNKQRRIPLCGEATLTVLSEYVDLYLKNKDGDGYFFRNRDGKKLSEQSIRNIINKYGKESCINTKITPHMFRHTVATMLLENGADIRFIQCFLGHSSITTTQIYAHVNEEAQRKVVARCHPRGGFVG